MEPTSRQPDDELAILAADPEMLSMFVGEALDHLGTIESVVLQLEGAPADVKLLNDVFRPFHTVKGNAGALGVTSVQELAHCVESLLDLARAGRHAMGPDEFDIVLRAVDLLTIMMQELPDRVATGTPSSVTARRDALMEAVDALIAGGSSAAVAAPRPNPRPSPRPRRRRGRAAAAPGGRAGMAARRASEAMSTIKVDTGKLDNLIDMVGELVIAQSILAEDPALARSADERLGRRLAQLKRITSDLQRSAMSMRMVPIRQVFQKMARLVRDLSKQSGKHIELVLQGEETELDRKVVEDINDPLMHMVRNSVDHGIESPRAARRRRQAGAGDAAPERLARGRQRRHRDRRRRRRPRHRSDPGQGGRQRAGRRGRAAGARRRPPADLPARLLDRREGRPRSPGAASAWTSSAATSTRCAAGSTSTPRAARARRSRSGCR